MERWNGKVALVTGASAGIGAAIAVSLVKNGLIVVAIARRKERVEELKTQLGSLAHNLHAFQADVVKDEDIQAVFKYIKDKFGKIHVLVNNAGIVRLGNLTDANPNSFREVFNTNVMGLTVCTQEAVKLMRQAGVDDGHIIHISSVAAHVVPPFPGMNVYPASKHAVKALTETLRQELRNLKSNIRVTSISPGGVETEIGPAAFTASGTKPDPAMVKLMADMPMLKSEDIADSVVYVLSTPPHVQVHEIIIKPLWEQI